MEDALFCWVRSDVMAFFNDPDGQWDLVGGFGIYLYIDVYLLGSVLHSQFHKGSGWIPFEREWFTQQNRLTWFETINCAIDSTQVQYIHKICTHPPLKMRRKYFVRSLFSPAICQSDWCCDLFSPTRSGVFRLKLRQGIAFVSLIGMTILPWQLLIIVAYCTWLPFLNLCAFWLWRGWFKKSIGCRAMAATYYFHLFPSMFLCLQAVVVYECWGLEA